MKKVNNMIIKAKIKNKNKYVNDVIDLVEDFKQDYKKFLIRFNFFKDKKVIQERFHSAFKKLKIFKVTSQE